MAGILFDTLKLAWGFEKAGFAPNQVPAMARAIADNLSSIPFDTLKLATDLESAGLTWDQARHITRALANSLSDEATGANPGGDKPIEKHSVGFLPRTRSRCGRRPTWFFDPCGRYAAET